MTTDITLAFIGGSGLYDMSDLSNKEEIEVNTPFGQPSSTIMTGMLNEQKVAFLARHGKGHTISPSDINYRANIYALKALGVKPGDEISVRDKSKIRFTISTSISNGAGLA